MMGSLIRRANAAKDQGEVSLSNPIAMMLHSEYSRQSYKASFPRSEGCVGSSHVVNALDESSYYDAYMIRLLCNLTIFHTAVGR